MNKLIILFVLFFLALQPPCGKLDIRRKYIVAPICESQPVKQIAPITGLH